MTARPVAQSMFPDLVADKPVGPLPLSVQTGTNADLIYNIRDLYLTGSVLDVTYGRGGWWQRFTPDPFTFHDLALDGVDFRALPHPDRSFDAVCFDPPYVISGTASSRLGPEFQHRYGIGIENAKVNTNSGTAAFETVLLDGLSECVRVAERWVLVKCMEFSQGNHVPPSRSFHDVPHLVTEHARSLNCVKHDQIVHNAGTGPGGHNIWEAKRCRRAHSYLLVFAIPPTT